MQVSDLRAAVPAELGPTLLGAATVPVVDVTHDSRAVRPGWMFACVAGSVTDGHDHADEAIAAGAGSLLVERPLPVDVPQLVVNNTRRAMGFVASLIHGNPSSRLTLVGITGTNGKTTTSHLVAAAMRGAGRRVGVLGTLAGPRTTPESTDLQRQLAAFVDDGVDSVAMEVSSHALALDRVSGTRFDVGVFTNLGHDHLDLHGSHEEYFRAKARLFTPELTDVGVVNVDDPHGRLLADVGEIEIVPYRRSDATDVVVEAARHSFTWRDRRVDVPIGGQFNVMNSLAALTAAEVLGAEIDAAIGGLAGMERIAGRFEVVAAPPDLPFTVVVDYAHTPDGIAELLRSARQVAGGGRVTLVFGCGGERDVHKRPHMGAAAAAGADTVIVTSDNPRGEDPRTIIDDVLAGIAPGGARVVVEPDRRDAIAAALAGARTGDLVVVAGKGHEATQTVGDVAHPFDDRAVVRELLEQPT